MSIYCKAISFGVLTLLVSACGTDSTPTVSASGYVEVDGKRIDLAHPEVQASPWGWMLSLTDRPLADGCVGAASSLAMMETGVDFTGIDLSIYLPNRNEPTGTWWFAHPDLEPLEGRGLFTETTPVEVSEGVISGTYDQTGEAAGKTFHVHVEFALPTDGNYAPKVNLKGVEGAPANAFAAMMEAWLAGDVEKVHALSTAEVATQIDEAKRSAPEGELAQTLIGFADMLFMQEMEILEVTEAGDKATLQMVGYDKQCKQPVQEGQGTVELTREDGDWKVGKMDWKSTVQS